MLALAGGTSFWEKLSVWYEQSVIAELLQYFSERYFTVEFGTYENFSVSSDAGVTARNLILALAIGFIIAAVMTAYTRVVLGGFVRKLLKEECLSPASAKSLYELGYFRSVSIRRALKRGAALRMVVRYCDGDARKEAATTPDGAGDDAAADSQPRNESIDFMKACFYIPEELRFRADIRFDNKGSGWLPVIAVIAAIVVVSAVLCWFLPDIVQFADNLITVFSPQ